jgi:hypothetical protein
MIARPPAIGFYPQKSNQPLESGLMRPQRTGRVKCNWVYCISTWVKLFTHRDLCHARLSALYDRSLIMYDYLQKNQQWIVT